MDPLRQITLEDVWGTGAAPGHNPAFLERLQEGVDRSNALLEKATELEQQAGSLDERVTALEGGGGGGGGSGALGSIMFERVSCGSQNPEIPADQWARGTVAPIGSQLPVGQYAVLSLLPFREFRAQGWLDSPPLRVKATLGVLTLPLVNGLPGWAPLLELQCSSARAIAMASIQIPAAPPGVTPMAWAITECPYVTPTPGGAYPYTYDTIERHHATLSLSATSVAPVMY